MWRWFTILLMLALDVLMYILYLQPITLSHMPSSPGECCLVIPLWLRDFKSFLVSPSLCGHVWGNHQNRGFFCVHDMWVIWPRLLCTFLVQVPLLCQLKFCHIKIRSHTQNPLKCLCHLSCNQSGACFILNPRPVSTALVKAVLITDHFTESYLLEHLPCSEHSSLLYIQLGNTESTCSGRNPMMKSLACNHQFRNQQLMDCVTYVLHPALF